MTVERYRPAWAEVDLDAIRHNVRTLVAAADGAEVCAVVKADGYGHGAVRVSEAALDAGAVSLAVALVEEGIVLRDAGIEAPILLLSEPPPSAAPEVVARRFSPTVYTERAIDAFGAAASTDGPALGLHLKIDTGMHRVGAAPDAAVALARRIADHPLLELAAVWTHFAVADEQSRSDVTEAQRHRFDDACAAIIGAGMPVPKRHASNAAGTLYVGANYDLVRPGIAVYGYAPDPGRPVDLRPVLSLKAEVSHVKEVDAGERLSYGLRYELLVKSVVATVPLGYADGVPRRLGELGAEVLVGGRRCPIAGTVTMDQILVDCGPTADVAPGDEVVLLGTQGDERITADDWATRLGTISYEILCGIGPRVPRVTVSA
ncbi:MAG TPA: alanine racemase [Acidimicrobiales bacterium]|nr:alanine racemase [Acidimicrobiales bacterium]